MAACIAAADDGACDSEDRRVVVAGPQYHARGLRRILLGPGYRKLWTAPIEVPVLDLGTFAGGLLPGQDLRRDGRPQ